MAGLIVAVLGAPDGADRIFYGATGRPLVTGTELARIVGEILPGADIESDTRRMNAFIEERVLEMPEQYYWVHKRFKTRPAGERSPYE